MEMHWIIARNLASAIQSARRLKVIRFIRTLLTIGPTFSFTLTSPCPRIN
jgi:hypothetical protein